MINETLKRYSFPPFLIDRITKSYLNKVHSNSNQSNPESDKTHFINFHILENTQSKFRKSFQNSLNNSAKMLILKLFFYFFYINNYFSNKVKHPIFWSLFQFINLLVQDAILVMLAKPVVTLKLETMSMWKKTKNFRLRCFRLRSNTVSN